MCAILMGDNANKLAQNLQDKFSHANLSGSDRHFEQMVEHKWSALSKRKRWALGCPLDVPRHRIPTAFMTGAARNFGW